MYEIFYTFFTYFIITCAALNNVCINDEAYKSMFINDEQCWYNPNIYSDMEGMTIESNYSLKTYTVTTEDGYILTLFRIYTDKSQRNNHQPVLLMHGIGGSSEPWVCNQNKSLGFYLANNGYDVWMGNFRGNKYSRKHISFNTNPMNERYWSFSLYHLGVYDLPAFIQLIANTTKQEGNIIYIAHSMGTTASYIYACLKPADAKRHIKALLGLSPVGFLDENAQIGNMALYAPLLKAWARATQIYGLFTYEEIQRKILVPSVQFYPGVKKGRAFINFLFGPDPHQIPSQDVPMLFNTWPSGISIYVLLNFLDFYIKQMPIGYDYGKHNNEALYGSQEPPVFDYRKIPIPVHLFLGRNDIIADYSDAIKFYNTLQVPKSVTNISEDGRIPFNHINFLHAVNMTEAFYVPLMKLLKTL